MSSPLPYRLQARNAGGQWGFDDPYRFGPVLGPMDDYLIVEGTHRASTTGWARIRCSSKGRLASISRSGRRTPRRVSVVGDFNDWDGRRHQMRKRIDIGLWEIFAPDVGEGSVYKYEIIARDGRLLPLKADPFGFAAELRPSTASLVARTGQLRLGRSRISSTGAGAAIRGACRWHL